MSSYRCCVFVILSLGLMSSAGATQSPTAEPTLVFDAARSIPFFQSDVVVVIDRSALALVASGIDVDKNGVVGRDRTLAIEKSPYPIVAQMWTTDAGDTVGALQLNVAQALVERLDLRQNRVGLVSFTIRSRWRRDALIPRLTDKPGVIVPVGKAEAVLAALADFPPAQERMRTDLSRLLERGAELLDAEATQIQPIRPRAILLLYLGQPSAPDGIYFSSRRAVERAAALGERGISIWAIPIRPGDIAYLDELTRGSGGGVIGLDQLDARFGVPRSEGP